MEEELYKDISEIKKGLSNMRGKDVSPKELHDEIQKLNATISEMLEVFGAAAEQMKLEEQGYEANAKKHDMIISKLDKIIDQNKTIAEGMVAIVDMVKEKMVQAKEETRPRPEPRIEPRSLFKPQQEWQPKPEPVQRTQPMPMMPQQLTPPMPQIGQMPPQEFAMPPMQPADMDFPELGLEEEPKKKGLFGMFKK